MATPNLKSMTSKQLQSLIKKAQQQQDAMRKRERLDLRTKIVKQVHDAGFTLDEVFGKRSKSKASIAKPPKYANPDNPGQTWSGYGRAPGWIVGKDREKFLIRSE